MSDLILQTAQLMPQAKRLPSPSGGAATALVIRSAAPPGARTMLVIEADGSTKHAEEVVDRIVQAYQSTYEASPTAQSEDERFNHAIHAVNQEFAEKKQPLSECHAIIVHFHAGALSIVNCGRAAGYLMRDQQVVQLTSDEDSPTDTEMFSSVASGKLQLGDHLVLISPSLSSFIPHTELTSIVKNTTPSLALRKISEFLETGAVTQRIAAIVAAVTTPELSANQPLNLKQGSLVAARRESLANTMTDIGLPAAKKTGEAAVKLGEQTVQTLQEHILPAISATADTAGLKAKETLKTRSGRRFAAIASIILTAIIIGYGWQYVAGMGLKKSLQKYDQAFAKYSEGVQLAEANKPTDAKQDFHTSTSILHDLERLPNLKTVDGSLKKMPKAGDPRNVAELAAQVAAAQDKLDGILHVQPTSLKKFNQSASLAAVRTNNNHIATLDTGRGIIDIQDTPGPQTSSISLPKSLGKVVGVSAITDDQTMFLLTAEPAVWTVDIAAKTVAKVELSSGKWPTGTAIQTYTGNIYIISTTAVYKQVPTLAGFSVPQTTINLANIPNLSPQPLLAIDGTIYLVGTDGPVRFVAGKQAATTTGLPAQFQKPTALAIDDKNIYLLSSASGRIARITLGDDKLIYKDQISTGLDHPTSIDVTGGTIYITTASGLYKAILP